MQTQNANPSFRLTCRHLTVTDPIKDYVRRKVAGLHLDYPKMVEVHALLSIEKHRHSAEVIVRCSNHITLKAGAESADLYAAIDQVVDRIARMMRKAHTRLMRNGSARRHSVRTGPSELRYA
jgi:putative sigma-54 modulation protein